MQTWWAGSLEAEDGRVISFCTPCFSEEDCFEPSQCQNVKRRNSEMLIAFRLTPEHREKTKRNRTSGILLKEKKANLVHDSLTAEVKLIQITKK